MAELSITVDGNNVPAEPGEVIIRATDRAGIHVPRFCYHPRMEPVGMCRMCLVEVSGPRGMSLQPACFITVADGMEVVTDSQKVKKAQDGVLEFLLVNHPLDCPVCDKGGECPLQDQTLAYGPAETRFVEEKRHWAKPIELSDLVLLDRERCIQCARCTRFADEVAGEPMIDFLSRGDEIEVAIFPEERFNSHFSGNTVQICPVGALTSTPYRFAARPWDLEQVESTCTSCAMGCREVVQSSADRVIRRLGVDSDPLNRSWLCDKGRFDYEAHYGPSRVTAPMLRKEGELIEVSWSEAIAAAAQGVSRALDAGGPESVGVVGGARLSNEDAYAWVKLAKSVIGTDSVDACLGDGLPAATILGLPKATIDEVCSSDLVVLLDADLHEDAPVLHLRLRAALKEGSTRLLELSALPTALSKDAALTLRHTPGESATLAAALVAPGDPKPPVEGAAPPTIAGVAAAELAAARELLRNASSISVVVGRSSLAESGDIVAAAASSFSALAHARFLPVYRRANLHGALDAGMSPGLLPGRMSLDRGRVIFGAEDAWGKLPTGRGKSSAQMLHAAALGELGALIVLGADPADDVPDHEAPSFTRASTFVVAVTAHLTASAAKADVLLPAAMHAERSGTTTNFEGRVSTLGRKVTPPGRAWEDWAIACELASALGGDLGFESVDDIFAERERLVPLFRHAGAHVWTAPASRDGLILPLASAPVAARMAPRPIDPMATPGIGSLTHHPVRSGRSGEARSSAGAGSSDGAFSPGSPVRGSSVVLEADPASEEPATLGRPDVPVLDSYSLRLVAPKRLYDRGTHVAESEHLAGLAAEGSLHVNHYDLDRLGAKTGDRLRAVSPGGAREVLVEVDDVVPRGVALMYFNAPPAGDTGTLARDLIDSGLAVTDIRLEALR